MTAKALKAGIPVAPLKETQVRVWPQPTAGQRTGNVSAGTSVFAMVVLEKELKKVHPD